MSRDNGVVRIGRKGIKKFAIGEEGEPFEVDVIVTFQAWIIVDESFREESPDGSIPTAKMPIYHQASQEFVLNLLAMSTPDRGQSVGHLSVTEAMEFIARLRDCYREAVDFFRPRYPAEPESPGTSESALRFSEEPS